MFNGISLDFLKKIQEGIAKAEEAVKEQKPVPVGEVSHGEVAAIKDGMKQLDDLAESQPMGR